MTDLHEEALSDANLDEAIGFMRSANPFAQHVWGWDTGRFIDFRWGSNNIRSKWNDEWFGTNCRVFRDGSEIAAMAIVEEGTEYVCVITRGAQPDLVAEILTLRIADNRERGIGISLEFTRDEQWLREVCRAAGLSETDDTGREWEYELESVDLEVVVPDGYTATTLREQPDLDRAALARCIERSFGISVSLEEVVVHLEQNPMFLPELTSFVLAPDGTVAAYCRGTVDPVNGICGIDPVCTDPDHQRLGLGKAAVRTLMGNQRKLGGRYAYIGSAPPPAPGTFLYRSLGPNREYVGCEWSA